MVVDETQFHELFEKSRRETTFMIIAIGEEWEVKENDTAGKEKVLKAYEKIRTLSDSPLTFVITTCTDDVIDESGVDMSRVVKPCGSRNHYQCADACNKNILELSDPVDAAVIQKGICPECGAALVPNLFSAKPYVETAYLAQWRKYMRFLQATVNQNTLLLELGMGFRTPQVVRFPFERTAGVSKKTFLYRVHEELYQLPEHLVDKGYGLKANSIDFILK